MAFPIRRTRLGVRRGPAEPHPERLVGEAWCSWSTLSQRRRQRAEAFGSLVAVRGKQKLGPWDPPNTTLC